MRSKLDRVLKRHGIQTTALVSASREADPRGRGYSRTYIYGLRRGEVTNPTQRCMSVVTEAVRRVTRDRSIDVADVFDFPVVARRKAS